MKKRFTLLLIFLFVNIFLSTSLFAYDVEKDGIYYNVVRKAKIAEVTNGEKKYSGEIKIPSTIIINDEEMTVSKIGAGAFDGCSSLTSVVIPATVTIIDNRAFMSCTSLSSIAIPNSVESIGEAAFYGCSSLSSIVIPNSVKNIARLTFEDCTSLISVTIPKSVNSIGESAFWHCRSLSKVFINDIGAWCEIKFGENGGNPLDYAKGLFLNNQLITDLVVPNTVKTISERAFIGYESLTSVTLPNSVTCIDNYAFLGCSSLSAVAISNSVELIGKQAFSECTSLKNIIIPNSVKKIMDMAFWRCGSLTSIVIPNSVVFLGQEVFSKCTALSEVSLGSSVQKLEKYTFSECKELSSVYCHSETPPVVDANCFKNSFIEYVRLYVPQKSVDVYKTADVWKNFNVIKALEDKGEEEKQCSTPRISYSDGKLQFVSDTEGANYYYSLNVADAKTEKTLVERSSVDLSACYDIECYARADGYTQSETAKATLYWLNAEGGDDTDNINLVKTRGVMVTTDNDITISGLNNGEVVTFYSVGGVNLGRAKAVQGVLHFAKPNESIIIAKIKGSDLKIAIK